MSQLANIPVEFHFREFCEACLELLGKPNAHHSILTDVLPSLARVLRECGRTKLPLVAELAEWKQKSQQVTRMAQLHCGAESAGLIESLSQVSVVATSAIDALLRMGSTTQSDVVPLLDDLGTAVQVGEASPAFEASLWEFCDAVLTLIESGPDGSSILPQTTPSLHRIFGTCTPIALARLRAELNVSRTTSEQLMQFAGAHHESAAMQLQARIQLAQDQADRLICALELLASAADGRIDGKESRDRSAIDIGVPQGPDGGTQSADVYYQLANQSYQRQDLRTAETLYSEALRLDDKLRLAWLQRGRIRLLSGSATQAVTDLTRALQLFSDDPITLRWRADAFSMCGRLEEALKDYEQSLKMMPESVVARYNRAVVLRLTGRFALASSELTAMLKHRSCVAGARLNLGLIRLAQEQTQQAIEEFQAALAAQPGLPEAIQHLSDLGVEIQEPAAESAAKAISKATPAKAPVKSVSRSSTRRARPTVAPDRLTEKASSATAPTVPDSTTSFDDLAVTLLSETSIDSISDEGPPTPIPDINVDEPLANRTRTTASEIETVPTLAVTGSPARPAGQAPQMSIDIRCPACEGLNTIRADMLQPGKAITCKRCVRHFSVQADGSLVRMVKSKKGKWNKHEERWEWWKDWRLVAAAASILLIAGLFWFQPSQVDGYIAEDPGYPKELEPRAKMFTLAWLKGDYKTMRQLSDAVQSRELFVWAMDHPIPVLASPATLERDATLDVEILGANPPNASVHIRIDGLRIARGEAVPSLTQEWKQEGERWIFLPAGRGNL
ncbi:MAG: Flp pilus assembly protein TadD [Schlesneria sp.]|nr:Flp pilus assembly protein TadD [Schlesneria sp.]